MAGLEVLFACVSGAVARPQDAAVCFVHWEIIRNGYKCLGTGDEPRPGEKTSELLPPGWNASGELYTLRYRSNDGKTNLLFKAVTVDSTLIFNLMDTITEQVSDLTVNVSDYIDSEHLREFESVFRNTDDLAQKVKSNLLPSPKVESCKKTEKKSKRDTAAVTRPDIDPLRIPQRPGRQPDWSDPMAPFAAGGADLDPFGGRSGGMIVDPLRAGFPRSGFDPSAGIPGSIPPGAVPPGARFDPVGPMGRYRPGPDPDHLRPPEYDDMFM
ncbi:proteasome inhibitor PI31 subunit [Denticeps clupeoides]|uniref:Proteasome inhibitor PI31 subunit n=1 Tax=Denticeps clupeoides TaxID=299321 RepID=A0AAY4ETD9_9TELE|nr:proteasome inhibitor PI31 subunit [Denticeps clupeoides]